MPRMNRPTLPYVLIGLFLLGWTSLSQNASDKMRSCTVAAFTPAWNCASKVQKYIEDRPIASHYQDNSNELLQLRIENQMLRNQMERVKGWMLHEKWMQCLSNAIDKTSFERRRAHLSDLLRRQAKTIPARTIYRDPTSWSSSLWINVGEEDNRILGETIIEKNSSVVDGNSLIGVVDYVGKRQSRVRLITDSSLNPAVRAVRGASGNIEIAYLIDSLSDLLKKDEEGMEYIAQLEKLKENFTREKSEIHLAKGELRGCGRSFWHAKRPLLKGVGFNYDYADGEGPTRELCTGQPSIGSEKRVPLIQRGDHLITSGLDGLFPPGLSVAIVKTVYPLKEGSFAYEIEALPTALSLNDLKEVFVLPSLNGE